MYMHICTYTYMYICIYTYIALVSQHTSHGVSIHMCVCMYIRIYTYINIYIRIYTYLYICIYTYIALVTAHIPWNEYTYVYICIYVYIHTFICIYVYLHICIYVYIHTSRLSQHTSHGMSTHNTANYIYRVLFLHRQIPTVHFSPEVSVAKFHRKETSKIEMREREII